MNARAVTIDLIVEGPTHGIPALPPIPAWVGLSAFFCGFLPDGTIAGREAWDRIAVPTACSMESGQPEPIRSHLPDSSDCPRSCAFDLRDWADVRASLEGDEQAYARLVGRYQKPISDYLWRFTRDRNEWEELVQEVFVEAYLYLPKFAGKAPLLHWLKRIATRVGYRCWRDRRRRRESALPADADSIPAITDDTHEAQHAAEVVHGLLAELRPRDRLVLTLAYWEGCSVKETAQLTGWTETMVKVQAHRARRRLAKICEQRGFEL